MIMKTTIKTLLILLFSNYSFSQCIFVFTDNGGATANYAANSDNTITICPTEAYTVVTVTFTEFNTEAEHDGLYVYDGNSSAAPQIASTNSSGFVPGGLPGSFWGNTIPGPFTSTSPDGCLTFRFRSDDVNQNLGWIANVNSCTPINSGFDLHAFLDSNANGIQEVGEYNFPLGDYHFIKNGTLSSYLYNYNGNSIVAENNPANTYDFDFNIYSDYSAMYSTNTPSFSNVSIGTYPNVVTLNFPITALINYSDLAVTSTNLNKPKAGFAYTTRLSYTNYGNTTIDGSLTFVKDTALTIASTSQTVNITPTGFNYSFSNLLPFQTQFIDVTMSVPSIPTVSIGQLLTNSASVSTPNTETILTNNTSSFTEAIVAAYDPNDKTESHGEKIVFSTFNTNDYLKYTIRFENTGTAPATNVSVIDIIDSQIDETSIKMLSSSHNYVLNRVENTLAWDFNNINLPVSVADTNIGKGFITFKAKLKPGIALGDVIPNNATIYFDSNPAIQTNTFETEFVSSLSNPNFILQDSITLSPNPTKNILNITSKQDVVFNSVSVYDILGQLVLNNIHPLNSIDVSSLKTGKYFIKITTDKGVLNNTFVKD